MHVEWKERLDATLSLDWLAAYRETVPYCWEVTTDPRWTDRTADNPPLAREDLLATLRDWQTLSYGCEEW